jgi:hypothetical protein
MASLRSIATVKKKKIKPSLLRKSSSANILVEEKNIGSEITSFGTSEISDSDLYQNLRYYGYFFDTKDAFSWALDWVKANKTKEEISTFNRAEEWRVNTTLGAMCKMLTNGAVFSFKQTKWINEKLQAVIDAGKKIKEVKQAEKTESSGNEKVSEFISSLEKILDEKSLQIMAEFSVFNELKRIEASHLIAKETIKFYTPLRQELQDLLTKKDPDLVEGYKHLKLSERKLLLSIVDKFITDCEQFMDAKKAVRKPRAKKTVSKVDLFKTFKFQKDSAEYQVSSLAPINIIGSNQLVLFNTKYRQIVYLISNDPAGFTVKGTTILNVDETKSFKKTVRTPEILKKILNSGTKLGVKKSMDELKSVSSSCTGAEGSCSHRTQESSLILKAYK